MRALAATSCCSAARMSGRRSSNSDGSPAGTSTRIGVRSQRATARNGAGVAAEQHAERVLELAGLTLEVGDVVGGGGQLALAPSQIELRADALPGAGAQDAHALAPRVDRSPADRELLVDLEQRDVARRHVAHERQQHRAPRLLGGQDVRARGFRRAREPTPQIHLERQVERGAEDLALQEAAGHVGHREGWERDRGQALVHVAGPGVELGKARGIRRDEARAGLLDPGRRDAHVVARRDRLADELDEHGVLEVLPPAQVGDRGRALSRLAPDVGHGHRWPFVVGTQETAAERQRQRHPEGRTRADHDVGAERSIERGAGSRPRNRASQRRGAKDPLRSSNSE